MRARVLLLLSLLLFAPHEARSATLTVTSLLDDGSAGTLRSQIAASLPGDQIDFAVTGTIVLLDTLPITSPIVLSGPGVALLRIELGAGAGVMSGLAPGLTIDSGASLVVSELELGVTFGATFHPLIENAGTFEAHSIVIDIFGPCLMNTGTSEIVAATLECKGSLFEPIISNAAGATLQIADSNIELSAQDTIAAGIENLGELEISESTLEAESLFNGSGGTLDFRSSTFQLTGSLSGHVGLSNSGTAHVEAVSLLGGGGPFDVGVQNSGVLVLLHSTISGAQGAGGAVGISGLRNTGGTLSVLNSTISGTEAQICGQPAGLVVTGGDASIYSTTLSGNGGNSSLDVTPTTRLRNVIVENHGFGACPTPSNACAGTGSVVGSAGTSLSDDASCTGFTITTPMLGPLQDNGGPTPTHAPLAGSPAIDAVPAGECLRDDDPSSVVAEVPLLQDQRFALRAGEAACDAGAVEVVASLPIGPGWALLVCALSIAASAALALRRQRSGMSLL